MDILNPQLINIDGRIYCDYNSSKSDPNDSFEHNHKNPNQSRVACWDEEPCDENETLPENSSGKFETALSVPSAFFKYIIGVQGKTKKSLELETGAKIQIPGKGIEGDIKVTAAQQSSVLSACLRIELLVSEKRWKQPFTHFVSIPLTDSKVGNAVNDFKMQVLDATSGNDIEETLFQSPKKFHLTVCTLVLLNQSEIQRATEAFNRCVNQTVADFAINKGLSIQVKGLEYMNDDPAAVDVLYAKVKDSDGSDTLQKLVDTIAQVMAQTSLSENQYDKVKLHATVMNSTYRMAKDQKRKGRRATFNAKPVLQLFEDYDFGSVVIDQVHLSQRYTTADNGYYKATEVVSF